MSNEANKENSNSIETLLKQIEENKVHGDIANYNLLKFYSHLLIVEQNAVMAKLGKIEIAGKELWQLRNTPTIENFSLRGSLLSRAIYVIEEFI